MQFTWRPQGSTTATLELADVGYGSAKQYLAAHGVTGAQFATLEMHFVGAMS